MRLRLFPPIALFLIASCGVAVPDDAPFLTELGFDKPVAFQWHPPTLTSADLNQGSRSSDDAALAALLVKEGALTVQPDLKPPWWHFATADGQDPQEGVTITIGSRQIDSHSEIKHWQEGSTDNFGETVTYHIQLADGFQKAGISYPQSFAARVLADNDPSVGHWTLAPTQGPLNDTDTIKTALTETGRNYVNDLRAAIIHANTLAFDTIENNLKVAGVLARTAQDPHVLISKRSNFYIYSGRISITGQTINQLDGICGALQTKVGGPWHAPNYQDLLNTVVNQSNPNFLTLNDTPDRRLLGELIGNVNGMVTLQSKDTQQLGPSYVWTVLNINDNGYLTSDMRYDLSSTFTDADRLICMSKIGN